MSQLPYLIQQADQAMQDGDWEKAQQHYQEALDLNVNNQRAAEGVRRARKAAEKEADLQARIAEADVLFDAGKYQAAAEQYIAITESAVVDPRVLKFHPYLERRRREAKDLTLWQARVQKLQQEVGRLRTHGDLGEIPRKVDALLDQLPKADIYRPLRNRLDEVRAYALRQLGDAELYNKAFELLRDGEFEKGLERLQIIAPSSQVYAKAQRLIRSATERITALEKEFVPIEEALKQGRFAHALTELENLPEQDANMPRRRRLMLQAGMAHGKALLEQGREANQQRNFEPAQRRFEEARAGFEKVLKIYPTHLGARSLRDECVDLIAITGYEHQAQVERDAGRRADAVQALSLAQQQIAAARGEGRDYAAVGAVVNLMLNTVQAEIARIREDERTLRDAESQRERKHLNKAQMQFRKALGALLPEHQRQAAEGLRRVEATIQQFETLKTRGATSTDAFASVAAYQEAYEVWPDGPEAGGTLESALMRACEAALDTERLTEAVGYGQRALALNPENRAVKRRIAKAGVKPEVEATLEEVQRELAVVQRQDEISAAALDPLLRKLEAVLRKAEAWPDLRKRLEAQYQTIREQRRRWEAYEQRYVRAQTRRNRGEWADALVALTEAKDALGDVVPAGVAGQIDTWTQIGELLERVAGEVVSTLAQAQKDYAALAEQEALSAIGDGLKNIQHLLDPARKSLEGAEEQALVAHGPLPGRLGSLKEQVEGLSMRVEAALEAVTTASASDGLLKIQEAIRVRGSDDTLETVRGQLEERAHEAIAAIKQQAQTDIQAGDLTEAEDKLRQVCELDPKDTETAHLYAEIRQRRQMEARLRQIEREADGKLASSPADAMKTLRQGLNMLLEPDVALPEQARDILSALIALGDREDGLALGQPENWETVQNRLAELGKLRAENWAAGHAVLMMEHWSRLARDNALLGVVASASQLGDLLQAYRAAKTYLRRHPQEPLAIEKSVQSTEALIGRANDSAGKRIHRAQTALNRGNFEAALNDLRAIEDEFYRPIEQEFPDLLVGQDEVQRTRDEVIELQVRAEKLQKVYEQAQPTLESARQASHNKEWDAAEKSLDSLPVLTEIPDLQKEVDTLRGQVGKGRIEATRHHLQTTMSQVETGRRLATTPETLADYVQKLEALQGEINIQLLDVEERQGYYHLLAALREQRESLAAGAQWEELVDEYIQSAQYIDALDALDEALKVVRDGGRRVSLETQRRDVERKAQAQQDREEALKRGNDLFAEESYVEARRQFEKARHLGAEVADLLAAARAGALLQSAQRQWETEHDGDNALSDLDELDRLATDNTPADSIRESARYLRRKIDKALKRTREMQHRLAEAQRLISEGKLTEAQNKVQQILERAPASQEALELQKQISEQRMAQGMLEKAQAAQNKGRYQEALRLAAAVLKILPTSLEAFLLRQESESALKADKAIVEVEILAKQQQFKEARARLTELSREASVDSEKLRKTQQLVEDLEKAQWTKVVYPIQEDYRNGKYVEAWNAVRQALGRTAAPELRDELTNWQNRIVNGWAEKQVEEARRKLQRQPSEEELRDLEVGLKPFLSLEPAPEQRVARQIEDLLRDTRTRRLRAQIVQARKHYQEWKDGGEQGQPQAALNIIGAVQKEAEALGTQVEFNITLDALALEAEIQEGLRQRDEKERRERREALLKEAGDRKAKLQDPEYISKNAPGERDIVRVAERANDVLKIPGYEQDDEARALVKWAQDELVAFKRTRQALDEAQAAVRKRRFREANFELHGVERVSPLLKDAYERRRELVDMLERAEEAQDNQAWAVALQNYRKAVELDPELKRLLENDLHRCYERLLSRVRDKVQEALARIPPDTEKAGSVLEQAEHEGWIAPAYNREYSQLRDWLACQEQVKRAITLLQANDGDLATARAALREARRLLPRDQADTAIQRWEAVAEALVAWEKFQKHPEPERLSAAREAFDRVPKVLSGLGRVKKLRRDLSEAEARQKAQTEKAQEISRLLDELKQRVKKALQHDPRNYKEAVRALEGASREVKNEACYQGLCAGVQKELKTSVERLIKALDYAQAIEQGKLLERIPNLDEESRTWIIGLPGARREALNDKLRRAEEALSKDDESAILMALGDARKIAAPADDPRIEDLDARWRARKLESALSRAENALTGYDTHRAEAALRAAETIAAPHGDDRIPRLHRELEALCTLLQNVGSGLQQVRGLRGQKQWQPAVERLLTVRNTAPRYAPVSSEVSATQESLVVQAKADLKDGKFAHGLALCDLAMQLKPRDDVRALQQQIRNAQEAAVVDLREQVHRGLDNWQVESVRDQLVKGLDIAPDDATLLRLQQRYDSVAAILPALREAMNEGWEALQRRDYPATIAAFDKALRAAPNFGEAEIWRDYARALRAASHQMQEGNSSLAFDQSAQLLRQADELMRVHTEQILSDIFGNTLHLQERHRHAVYNAWRLRQSARRVAGWYEQSDQAYARGNSIAMQKGMELFDKVIAEKAVFLRFHDNPSAPPETFPVTGREDEPLPADAVGDGQRASTQVTTQSEGTRATRPTKRPPTQSAAPESRPTPVQPEVEKTPGTRATATRFGSGDSAKVGSGWGGRPVSGKSAASRDEPAVQTPEDDAPVIVPTKRTVAPPTSSETPAADEVPAEPVGVVKPSLRGFTAPAASEPEPSSRETTVPSASEPEQPTSDPEVEPDDYLSDLSDLGNFFQNSAYYEEENE